MNRRKKIHYTITDRTTGEVREYKTLRKAIRVSLSIPYVTVSKGVDYLGKNYWYTEIIPLFSYKDLSITFHCDRKNKCIVKRNHFR